MRSAWTWALWGFNGFLWPLLANRLTLRSPEPAQAAQRVSAETRGQAYQAWLAKARETLDNAQMRYFIVHLHRLLDPAQPGQ